MTLRDDYVEKMKSQIDALNAEMQLLEAKAQQVSDETRDKYNVEIEKLHQQSHRSIDMLAELKVASEDSWQSLVAETEKVRDAFIHSFHYFKSQL